MIFDRIMSWLFKPFAKRINHYFNSGLNKATAEYCISLNGWPKISSNKEEE